MTEHQRQLLSAYLDDALDAAEAAEFSSLLEGASGDPQLAHTLQTYIAIGEAMRGRAGAQQTSMAARVSLALRDEPVPTHVDPLPVALDRAQADNAQADNVVRLPAPGRPGWYRVVRSVAMAATVAAVAIGGMRLLNSDAEVNGDAQVAVADVAGSQSVVRPLAKPDSRFAAGTGDDVARAANSDSPAPAIPLTTLQLEHLPTPALVSTGPKDSAEPVRAAALSTKEWDRLQPNVEARMQAYFLQHSEMTRNSVRGMLPYARLVGYESSRH